MIRPALASNSLVMPRLVKEVNSLSQRLGAKPSLNFVIISEFIWREEKYALPASPREVRLKQL